MKTKLSTLLLLSMALNVSAGFAQELVPATSEDIQEFDRQLARQKSGSNFGAQVQEEAKKLKDGGGADANTGFGKWVSSQRRKNDEGRPSAATGSGNNSGASHGKSPQSNPSDKNKGKKPK